jgi:hypothetical protein
MVAEHNSKGFPSEWLGRTFAMATMGNSVVAIVSGIIAQKVQFRFAPTNLKFFSSSSSFFSLYSIQVLV